MTAICFLSSPSFVTAICFLSSPSFVTAICLCTATDDAGDDIVQTVNDQDVNVDVPGCVVRYNKFMDGVDHLLRCGLVCSKVV